MITHFVYPYKIPDNPIFGWELMFSLRALEANFKGDFDITIIGDIPSWINTSSVLCIQHNIPSKEEYPGKFINPRYLLAADLYDDFMIIHDDMYMVNIVTPEDLWKVRYLEKDISYKFTEEEYNSLTHHQKIMWNVHKELKEMGIAQNNNYVTHAPFGFNSKKLLDLHRKVDLSRQIIIENYYYNFYGIEGEPIGDYRSGHYKPEDIQVNKKAKFLNHDEAGYIYHMWILDLLLKLFPKKSRFEKGYDV